MSPLEILADPDFPALKSRILAETGLDYYRERDAEVAERLARRLEATRAPDCAAYLRLLDRSPAGRDERSAVIAEFTIGETYFFRHREQFDALRQAIVPELLERRRERGALRIWSAGCANGAEPYSVSILLRSMMAKETAGWDISILGTDINRAFLARAAEASYGKWAFREGAEDVVACCFRRQHDRWSLRPELRAGVEFRYHNLAGDPAPPATPEGGGFDLVLCRNVLIYFRPETAREVAAKLHASLSEGGWLVVGHAEPSADVFKAFRAEFVNGLTFYRKLPPAAEGPLQPVVLPGFGIAPPPPPAPYILPQPPAAAPPPAPSPSRPAGLEEVRQLADRGRWEEAAARCRLLLDSRSLDPAVHFTLALILEHKGEAAEAERALRAALYLDRAFAVAHYHLGVLLHRRGAAGEARRAFRNVVDLLDRAPPGEPVPHGDGATAAELRSMAGTHLELLESS